MSELGKLVTRRLGSTAGSDSNSSTRPQSSKQTFIVSKGDRKYLQDYTTPLIYPLPADLRETQRQTLTTLLTLQVYGTPVLSPGLLSRPPKRVLEVGCDSGFWSAMCHKHYINNGHESSFNGIDTKPRLRLDCGYAEMGMDWCYIEHDLRVNPWPIADMSIDLVMARSMALAFTRPQYDLAMGEYLRVLRPGGTLEVWEHDYTIRALRPESQHGTVDPELWAQGVYSVDKGSTLGPAVNSYIIDYNKWITAAFGDLGITGVPCSVIGIAPGTFLAPHAEAFECMVSKRVAIPLSEIKWEREAEQPRVLTDEHTAVRRTALYVLIGFIEAVEPLLKSASGKSDNAWDRWFDKAKQDWLYNGGLGNGECLEFGAWSLKKKPS